MFKTDVGGRLEAFSLLDVFWMPSSTGWLDSLLSGIFTERSAGIAKLSHSSSEEYIESDALRDPAE